MAQELNEYLMCELVNNHLDFKTFFNYCEYLTKKYQTEEIITEVENYMNKYYPVSYFEKWLNYISCDIKSFDEIPFVRIPVENAKELMQKETNLNKYVFCPTNNIKVLCLVFNEKGTVKISYFGGGNYGVYNAEKKFKNNMAEIALDENDERTRVYTDLRNYKGLKEFSNFFLKQRKNLLPLF